MRRFAPAFGGRLSRRNIALSPHLWSATGVMFAIYAIANLVIGVTLEQVDTGRLLLLAGALGAVAAVTLVTRPPEPGTIGSHAVLAAAYLGAAGAVAAYAPHGSATVMAGLFTGPLLAIWLTDQRAIVAHLLVATAALLAAALLAGNDRGTLFSVLCYLPATWVLTLCCVAVLEAVEAQGEEYERLAMRDALTGVGNASFLADALTVELTRHRSTGQPMALVELQLDGFTELNANLGRSAGDGILTTIAAILQESAPPTASVARTAGDRFAIVLPATAGPGAAAYVETVRRRLALIDTGGVLLSTRAGIAAFPLDGARAEHLERVAAERRAVARPEHREPPSPGAALGGLSVQVGEVLPPPQIVPAGTPSPEAQEAWASTRVDREGIAQDRLVWRLTGAIILGFGLLSLAGLLLEPAMQRPATIAVTACAILAGLAVLAMRAPAIGTPQNHAVITTSWLLPTAGMAACAPHASWAAGTTAFAGVLMSVRLVERRHILAHLAVATAIVVALLFSGRIDTASTLAILVLGLSTWVLVAIYVGVFEATEAQARRMADLVLRDPVTGAGNERLLNERLTNELPRHRDMQMPLVLFDLQLTGLDALRAHEGRGAAEDVLRDVAVLLGSAAERHATISRIHSDRFRMLLPLTGPDDVEAMARDLRIAIAGTSRRGRMILARMASASFPEDGVTAEALVAIAADRMQADDPRAHDLIGAPEPDDLLLPVRRTVDRRPGPASDHTTERRRAG